MEECRGEYRCVARMSEIGCFGYIYAGGYVVFEVCAKCTTADMLEFLLLKCEV